MRQSPSFGLPFKHYTKASRENSNGFYSLFFSQKCIDQLLSSCTEDNNVHSQLNMQKGGFVTMWPRVKVLNFVILTIISIMS